MKEHFLFEELDDEEHYFFVNERMSFYEELLPREEVSDKFFNEELDYAKTKKRS